MNFIDDIKLFRTYLGWETPCPLIVSIDCGHGGLVHGKYQTQGKMCDHGDFIFYEGVFNRQIGKALSQKLWGEQMSYTFTTISNYDDPLKQRIEYLAHFVKQHPTKQHLLLSLHANAAGIDTATGFEFFSTPGVTDSDYAANFYFPYMYDLGLKMRVNKMQAGEYDKESNFYIIRKAEELGCMALLFEAGFFTNKDEAAKMLTPDWQQAYVNALYRGTRDVIEKIKKDGTVRPT